MAGNRGLATQRSRDSAGVRVCHDRKAHAALLSAECGTPLANQSCQPVPVETKPDGIGSRPVHRHARAPAILGLCALSIHEKEPDGQRCLSLPGQIEQAAEPSDMVKARLPDRTRCDQQLRATGRDRHGKACLAIGGVHVR